MNQYKITATSALRQLLSFFFSTILTDSSPVSLSRLQRREGETDQRDNDLTTFYIKIKKEKRFQEKYKTQYGQGQL
jgi:hypothetical protein